MVDRRPLIDGLKPPTPPIDPSVEKAFVYGTKHVPHSSLASETKMVARAPLSTRIRSDFVAALKRASLERQLKNVSPNSLQGIIEEAIEPWLRSNGYL